MAQTILVETNEELRKIYSLNLLTFVGTDVITRDSAEDAISILRILPEISLIITRAKIDDENTALQIYHYIKNEDLQTSLIVLGACPELSSQVICLNEPVNWENVVRVAATQLGVTLEQMTKRIQPDYVPVGLHFFYEIQKSPCDVYIRIKKSPTEFQFIKRIHSKDIFDNSIIKKYEDQGLQEFYISKNYIQHFTTYVTSQMIEKLEKEDLSLEDRIFTTSNARDIVSETIIKIGLDQASIELSETSINSMVKSVRTSPEIKSLLRTLFSSKISHAYQQCHLLALICHYILSKQSWYRPDHLHILSFVAFFADITLKSKEQMQISSLRDLLKCDLSEEEKKAVMNHAADATRLLESHPQATEYIKTVLTQSHGKLDGIGFEDNPGENLHPLSKVFIIADNFVKILLDSDLPNKKEEILPLLYTRFSGASYQKIIKTLESKFM